jgi:2'-hydroxyisoflavone reductase
MNLLLLGGTAFLGRAVARHAMGRGISVTCLARGSAPPPDGVALVRADRDQADALAPVSGRRWDAVVDVARQPGHVRRAVRDLSTRHWVLISTGNVYARFDRPEQDEEAALLPPLAGDVMADMTEYGPAKVACEEAVRTATATASIVRAGLIAGPGDWSGRSGYYVWRCAHPTAEDMLVPPDPTFPCALIDVDDLADWLVSCAVDRIEGTFNATGATTPLGDLLETCREVVGEGAPVIRPVPADVLEREGVTEWMGPKSLPLWISDPEWRYFATLDTSRARARGLRTRPLAETMGRTLKYELTRDEPRQAGLSDEDEIALRAALDRA